MGTVMVGLNRGRLIGLVVLIGVAGLLLSRCGSQPGTLTKKSVSAVGQVIAEELVQQLGAGSSIVLVKPGRATGWPPRNYKDS